MKADISSATVRNWARLNTDTSVRLTARANKRLSTKTFLPLEYLSDTENLKAIEHVIGSIISCGIDTFVAIYTLAVRQLTSAGLIDRPHVRNVLSEYGMAPDIRLEHLELPEGERDLLGLIYQGLSLEGEKNRKGSYYTPRSVVENMLASLTVLDGMTFLDPCCGSGSFLLSVKASPDVLYGIDSDPIAVFICKINLLLKFPEVEFTPQIYCVDFLRDGLILDRKFDYIATNPPWGAACDSRNVAEISSGESFSLFFVKAFRLLRENGVIRFLFPESVLNVKVHRDIREFMLSNGDITAITLYDGSFIGVTSKYVDIEVYSRAHGETVELRTARGSRAVPRRNFLDSPHKVFTLLSDLDFEIIRAVREKGRYTLCDSIWALGIVTGDNKSKLFTESTPLTEPIYTGKEILPYRLLPPVKHVVYDRKSFQQAADDRIYRAREKLVYKFISDKLVFAYDASGALFLNSANILIPRIPCMSVKTVMAFLNSELYRYLYRALFAEVKILKGNLAELPFPEISASLDRELSAYAEGAASGDVGCITAIENAVYRVFGINDAQRAHISDFLKGNGRS